MLSLLLLLSFVDVVVNVDVAVLVVVDVAVVVVVAIVIVVVVVVECCACWRSPAERALQSSFESVQVEAHQRRVCRAANEGARKVDGRTFA